MKARWLVSIVAVVAVAAGCAQAASEGNVGSGTTSPGSLSTATTSSATEGRGTSTTVSDVDRVCASATAEGEEAACLGQEITRLEGSIRATLETYAFGDPARKQQLDEMTNRWAAQRDDDCATLFLSDPRSHGMGLAYARCRYVLTASRLQSMETLVGY